MFKLSGIAAKISLLYILLISFVSMIGCEPIVSITIHNQTNETLQIFTGKSLIGTAQPGGKIIWKISEIFPKYEITAKNMTGNNVYLKDYTRDELIRKKWIIVIPLKAMEAEQTDNATGR